MAKHRAPVVKRRPVRRALRYVAGLPVRALLVLPRVALRALSGSLWLARGLAVGTLGLAWLAAVTALVTLASLAGRHGAELRGKIITHLLEPFGKRARGEDNPSPRQGALPPVPAPKPRARRPRQPSTLPRDVDPDPSLWPAIDNAWGGTRDPLVYEDDEGDSVGIVAMRGLARHAA